MKFKLLGSQEQLLNDTCYWTQANGEDNPLPPPINGVIDWPEKELRDLARYADDRASNVTWDAEADDKWAFAEARSLRALAKRLRLKLQIK